MSDPYTVLGVARGASDDEVKTAFRTLAKTCHPDLHPDDPNAKQRFQEINAAYDTITKGEPEPIQFKTYRTGDFRFDDVFFNHHHPFGDIFGEIRRRNSDTNLLLPMTLEEAFHGKELSISVPNGTTNRSLNVQVPAGVMDGMRLQVAGGGGQANVTLPAGDLYITVRIRPHERFKREGNNLVTMVPVSVFDVLLRKHIQVVNIEGHELSVTVNGARMLRLAGQGMPDPSSKMRGDLMVELFIEYPQLTPEQQELIRQASEKVAEPV